LLKSRPLYDPIKDLDPITCVAVSFFAIAINPSLSARTLKEFVAYAKANPGKLSFGHNGVGSVNYLTGELFKSLVGNPVIVPVPYRGSGPVMADLIGGQIAMGVVAVTGQVLEFHRSGKLRVLAVTSPTRLVGAPELPTAAEAGLPDLVATSTIGLLAPAGTPRPIIDQIHQATRTALVDPAYQQMLMEAGFEPTPDSGPEKFRKMLADDIALWTPVVTALGLKID
jgi:tripartite-type tricarboxylate transporter receptor subunit TctC